MNENTNPRRILRDEKEKTTEATWIKLLHAVLYKHTANTLTTEQRHCDIRPCRSSQYPSPVKRPSYSVLDKTKIQETFGIEIPYWTDSLKQCLSNLLAKSE